MGQSSDELREEINQRRNDAADKIDQLQDQFQSTTDDLRHQAEETVDQVKGQVRDTVDDTIETVKEHLDLREQVEERPLVSLGVALIGGFVLGGMLGGGGGGDRHRPNYGSEQDHAGGGLGHTMRHAFKSSGLEETFSNAAAAMMGSVTDEVTRVIDRNIPGFSRKMEQARHTSGSTMDKARQM